MKYSRGKNPNSHKLGLFQKGHSVPKEWILKIKEKKKGIKLTKEHIDKIVKKNTGKKRDYKTRMLLRSQRLGSKNPSWKGGITPIMKAIRMSFKYRQWRSDIFTRDDWTCRECNKRAKRGEILIIHAHHIKEFYKILEEYNIRTLEEALICEELWDINNGLTLCTDCHKKTKSYGHKKQKK